ncbi:MAG: hypothetical protein JSU87_02705 [Gemmatimonadota bacterium]|nr:MAG: hypothetical protein JSU87_02705 [Gemmatimonadota bacterium]
MGRIISVHEYALAQGVTGERFESAVLRAREQGLLYLAGLSDHRFLRGIRGASRGSYGALWVYESKESWERLWGPADSPIDKSEYPVQWRIWEDEVLSPLLADDPDRIRFSAYEEF